MTWRNCHELSLVKKTRSGQQLQYDLIFGKINNHKKTCTYLLCIQAVWMSNRVARNGKVEANQTRKVGKSRIYLKKKSYIM